MADNLARIKNIRFNDEYLYIVNFLGEKQNGDTDIELWLDKSATGYCLKDKFFEALFNGTYKKINLEFNLKEPEDD